MNTKLLVFVCTANTCRSPMAEALLRARMDAATWTIRSAGIYASDGDPASAFSVEALRPLGLDLTRHRSQSLTQTLVDRAELILPMTREHYWEIVKRHPKAREKILMLGSFLVDDPAEPPNIHDPAGYTQATYNETRDILAKAVDALAKYLSAAGSTEPGSAEH